MTSFKKYFLYHFKSTFLRFIIIAVLSALLVSTLVWSSTYSKRLEQTTSDVHLVVLTIVAIIISTLIPILELLPFKSRRNMDTILFLPIDRKKMAAVHFINGFLHIFLVNFICFTITHVILTRHSYPYESWNLILLFAFVLFGSLAIYSFTAFIFDRANTTADGIIWLVIYSVIGSLTYSVATNLYISLMGDSYFPNVNVWLVPGTFSPYYLLVSVWSTINRVLIPKYTILETTNSILEIYSQPTLQTSDFVGMIFWAILITLCILGFIRLFKIKRPENIGSVSTSAFGYKILLPLTAITLLTGYEATLEDAGLHVIILVALIIGYIVYRKSIRFKPIDYVSIALAMILPTLLNFLR